MEKRNDERVRIVTMLTKNEKEDLQVLAWNTQRSVSGYIRYLILADIEAHNDYD